MYASVFVRVHHICKGQPIADTKACLADSTRSSLPHERMIAKSRKVVVLFCVV